MAIKTYIPRNIYPIDDKSMVLLYRNVATATAAVSDFDMQNIPQVFKHLRIEVSIRSTSPATNDTQALTFNGDNGANYSYQSIQGQDTSPSALEAQSASAGSWGTGSAATSPSDRFGSAVIEIPFYSSTTNIKSWIATSYAGLSTSTARTFVYGGDWNSTAAISRVTMVAANSMVAGSRITLWGIK